MIRIAVLDDDPMYLDKVCEITQTAMFQLHHAYELKTYSQVDLFLKDLQNREYFDIYLLDVEMPQMNGLEVGRNIRQKYSEPTIIYITNHLDYALEAFEVNAYRYITKCCMEEKLPETLKNLLSKEQRRVKEKVYAIKTATSFERIAYSDIYYLMKEGKYVIIVHKRGRNKVRKTLEEALLELDSDEFVMIDRSYVANLKHAISLRQQQLTLVDGTVLPVSKPRLQQVLNEVVEFHKARGYV